MSSSIGELQAPSAYREARSSLFPSESSFDWFLRNNRNELIEAGALLRPTGRWLVAPQAFDQAVATIGARRARRA